MCRSQGKSAVIAAMMMLALMAGPAHADAVAQGQELAGQAVEAFDAADYRKATRLFREALVLRPNHPGLTLRLAAANVRAGNNDDAVRALEDYAAMGLTARIDDAEWKALARHPRWQALRNAFAANAKAVGTISIAATIDEPRLLAEGIAFDAATGRIFVGDVHKRRILAVAPGGGVTALVPEGANGVFGIFGLTLHNGTLWAASSAPPHMTNAGAGEAGSAGVFAFDRTGRLLSKAVLSAPKAEFALGDLTVTVAGEVYATDSAGGKIYRLKPNGSELEPFLTSDEFHSLQGIALSPGDDKLAIADYSNGIHVADRKIMARVLLPMPPHVTLHGIDGIVRYGRDLIAVQNGIDPQRVIRIRLNEAWTAVEGVDVLASNLPALSEPTLATLAGADLLVVGNGQWSRFNDDGTIKGTEPFAPTRIVRLNLPSARQ